ncbi:FAD-binding domain-containing protein [Durotheca rogersii]|uniref:FAD-binding domain-containing protein n=1 Tax=Durotheca rogersii TaxID=419775 RepID=UPI0022209134|nr:FAD-binding domain-containing protein [Durotheca rogersii]KAI5860495.1 FAD-binding domain-containing protein [Durotheca rogersii]
MTISTRGLVSSTLLLLGRALADTCSVIEDTSTIDVARPLDLSYLDEQAGYWSSSCSALKPSCIIFPKDAAEVAAVVAALANTTEQFAVKSGGHNPNNYWSSVAGGPLISTRKLNQVILNTETGVARVGPGQRLDSIAAELQGTGWTFVGGRIGNTGVGGLVLGGGLSYMSAQYGWSASSVLEFEIVLANGTVATASESHHPDLFRALKGGGNNFGVVTAYVLQLYRQDDVVAGNLVFARTPGTDARLLRAVRDFTEHNADDRAAIIVTAERGNIDLLDAWILFLFYDGPVVPPGTFDNFTAAGPLLNTLKVQSYAHLMGTSNWVVVRGSVVTIATETVPLPPAASVDRVLGGLHAHWRDVSGTTLLVPGIIASIAWQPFPKRIARAARARSADLIDTDDTVDRLIVEMNYSFLLPSDYDRIDQAIQRTYGGMRDRVLGWQRDGTLPDAYLPIFMNYGYHRQDYFGRLRPESRALARSVADRVDPDGLFRTRTGGWKP